MYGEYHSSAWPSAGVRCYSSKDLYNWTDEGMALTMIKSKEQFTNDPLISKLYEGRTDTDNIWADILKWSYKYNSCNMVIKFCSSH